jgi:hypothetical protein
MFRTPPIGNNGFSDLPPDRTAGVRAPVESSRTYRQGPCDSALTSIDWGTVGAFSFDVKFLVTAQTRVGTPDAPIHATRTAAPLTRSWLRSRKASGASPIG